MNSMDPNKEPTPLRSGTVLLTAFATACIGALIVFPLISVNPVAAIGTLVDFIGTSADAAGPPPEVPSTSSLIDDLRNADDDLIRRRAAWWLGEHEDRQAVPALEDALLDRSSEVRIAAAWALGEIKDPDSIEALEKTLDDGEFLVREAAVLALGEIERPSALVELARVFDREEELRGPVIWAFGEIRGHQAEAVREEAFAKWGKHPWRNHQVWTGAPEIRTRHPSGGDLEHFLGLLASQEVEDRQWGAIAIGLLGANGTLVRLNTLGPVDPLLDAMTDPAPRVRAAALWSLDEINPSRWRSRRHHDH